MEMLTDRIVDRLPPGTLLRDSKQPGLMVRVGRRTTTFRYEIAHRHGNKRITISKSLGQRPAMSVDEARAEAKLLDAERQLGKVPVAQRRGLTLGEAAKKYFEALGDSKWRYDAEGVY